MKEMVLIERIGFFVVEVNSFCDSCIPYPTEVLQSVHYRLPIVAAKANNLLLIVIKVYNALQHFTVLGYVQLFGRIHIAVQSISTFPSKICRT